VRGTTSRGPGAARNVGVAAAHGEFVCFLDDDDTWSPTRVSTAVAGIGDARIHAMAATRPTRRYAGDMRPTIDLGVMPLVGQVMIRRDDFVAFDPSVRVAEDTDWWMSMRPHAVFAWSDEVGLFIRDHAGIRPGVDPQVRFDCRRRIADKHLAQLPRHNRAVCLSRVASAAVLAGLRGQAVRYCLRSLAQRPTMLTCRILVRALAPARLPVKVPVKVPVKTPSNVPAKGRR
jgi:glycosyltransferase involved in cell wall biosynthesis